jgi:hypothetical protein
LDRYNIDLDREKFLTVCGKCGGNIITCEGEIYREIVRKKKSIIENRKIGMKENSEEGADTVPDEHQVEQELREERRGGEEEEKEASVKKSPGHLVEELEVNEQMTICGASCQVKNGREGASSEEGIHWVPRDREIFMCESCCQVFLLLPESTSSYLPMVFLFASHTGGMNKRNHLLPEPWFLLIIFTMLSPNIVLPKVR